MTARRARRRSVEGVCSAAGSAQWGVVSSVDGRGESVTCGAKTRRLEDG